MAAVRQEGKNAAWRRKTPIEKQYKGKYISFLFQYKKQSGNEARLGSI